MRKLNNKSFGRELLSLKPIIIEEKIGETKIPFILPIIYTANPNATCKSIKEKNNEQETKSL